MYIIYTYMSDLIVQYIRWLQVFLWMSRSKYDISKSMIYRNGWCVPLDPTSGCPGGSLLGLTAGMSKRSKRSKRSLLRVATADVQERSGGWTVDVVQPRVP